MIFSLSMTYISYQNNCFLLVSWYHQRIKDKGQFFFKFLIENLLNHFFSEIWEKNQTKLILITPPTPKYGSRDSFFYFTLSLELMTIILWSYSTYTVSICSIYLCLLLYFYVLFKICPQSLKKYSLMAFKNLYYLNKTNHHDITEVWLKLVFNTNVIL